MPAAVDVQYSDSQQRVATVRADVAFGDPTSDRFSMPGYTPVAIAVDGATGAATYTNAEMQAVSRAVDPDARMARVPGTNLAADGIAIPATGCDLFEQAAYRFAVAATAGAIRVTATFVRIRQPNA
ncbi:MAG: hypothetical protein ABFD65_14010 [Candidatus Polarisedimenticolia bacterium]